MQFRRLNRALDEGWKKPPEYPDLGLRAIQNIESRLRDAIEHHFFCIDIIQGGMGTANDKMYPYAVDPHSALAAALDGFTRFLRDVENPFPLRLPAEASDLCEVDETAEAEFEGYRKALRQEIRSLVESL